MREDDDDIQDYVSSRSKAMDKEYDYAREMRNRTLEEVAQEFDSLRIAFGDTAHSFATYVRDMKR